MNSGKRKLLALWPLFFLLIALEAAAALFIAASVPSEGVGGLFGFSPLRWALLSPLVLAVGLAAIGAVLSWKNRTLTNPWLDPDARPKLFGFLLVLLPGLAAASGVGAFLLRWYDPEHLLVFFERAWPLLAFVIFLSIQTSLWVLVLKFGFRPSGFEAWKPALVAAIVLLALYAFVSLSRLGLTPDPAYWGEPGVPMQGWQLGLALLGGLFFLGLSLYRLISPDARRTDLLISILIWILAAGIWLSVPNEVLKNSFYFPIDPPENQPLPYSDSAYYDYMAHSLLVGSDYTGQVPTRPLYILLLTGLHLIFGENYNGIIFGQSLVLAAIPVLFYLLGTSLHSRVAGVTIALLAIFREWTNLLVSSGTRVSNSKILLVDSPTLLLILMTCLLALRWLKRQDRLSAFLTGGSFGLLLLVRTQSMLIAPLLLVLAIMCLRENRRSWLVPGLLFVIGVFVSISPWLTHNTLQLGQVAFDAPFQYQVLASQYAYTGNLDFSAVDLENKSLSQILITFILKDPGFVAGFISNHFLATEIGALLALPLIFPFNGLRAPINMYWVSFDGMLSTANHMLILFYLTVTALGLGAAWRRWRWTGLAPLAINLGYALANGIGRFSGWRYDLPADWIVYFYFGIGFGEILFWAVKAFQGDPDWLYTSQEPPVSPANPSRGLGWIFPVMLFATLGFSPWVAKTLAPVRYPDRSPGEMQVNIARHPALAMTGVTPQNVNSFAAYESVTALSGRLLYPRFFTRGSGLSSSTPWPSYEPREYPRLGFKLLNRDVKEVVLPIRNVTFESLQGADVWLLGCQREGFVEARLLVLPEMDRVYLATPALRPCEDGD